jgi:glyoxylase-like metal-dependent hydrolase (beta-lactamase superfamily II)
MQQTLSILAIGVCANALMSLLALGQAAPEVTLTRLECGTDRPTADLGGVKVRFVFSCYLIKHGDDYMVWDSGQSMGAGAVAPKASLVDLLGQLELKPDQIRYVGISHYHGDHTGQVNSFAKSTLLIGKGDWDVLTDPKMRAVANPANFANWISGSGKVEPVPADKDVFGDGTVVMLNTPGHTPGHHSLLVKLRERGYVLLSGDLAHFHENYERNAVPSFNNDRGATLASIDRFKKIAANLNATVIIQHDARDIGKLPAFPAAAK